jgi:adhesin HecA-like repeat protein
MDSNQQVTLEVGKLDARGLVSAGGAELTLENVLQIVPADTPPSSYDIAPSEMGLPLFFSNL